MKRSGQLHFARVFVILAASSLVAGIAPISAEGAVPAQDAREAEQARQQTSKDLNYLFGLLEPPSIAQLIERRGKPPELEELLAPFEPEAIEVGDARPRRLETNHYQHLAESNQIDEALRLAVHDSIRGYESGGIHDFELATGLFAIANILEKRGDNRGSDFAYRACANSLYLVFGPTHPDLATCWARIAAARMIAGDFNEGERCARVSMSISRHFGDAKQSWRSDGLHNLGMAHGALGNLELAESLLNSALENRRENGDDKNYQYASSLVELSRVLRSRGQLERAEQLARESLALHIEVLPEWSPAIPQCLAGLAAIRRDRGDLGEAEALFRDSLLRYRKALGPTHPQVAITAGNLALLLVDRGELDESEHLLESTIRIHRAAGLRALLATALNNLAQIHALRGRDQEAETQYLEAIKLYRELYGENDSRVAIAMASLATHLHWRGDLEAAEAYAREALQLAQRTVGETSSLTANVRVGLAAILQDRGNLGEADEQASRALELHGVLTPPTHPRFAAALARLGSIRLDQGAFDQASELLLDALDRLDYQRGAIVGAERERALFAGRFQLGDMASELITADFYRGDLDSAVAIAERRSGRALLDLVSRSEYDILARAKRNEPDSAKVLEARLADEEHARSDLFEAEAAFLRAFDRDLAAEQVELARIALREAELNTLAVLSKYGTDPRPAGTVELRAGLDPSEVLLYVVWARPVVAILAVPPEGDQAIAGAIIAATEGDIARLEEEAKSLRGLIASSPSSRDGNQSAVELNERLAAFGARLFPQKILDALVPAARIVAIADGPLVGIPFDSLLEGNLGENHEAVQVSYASSGTLHLRLRESGKKRSGARESRALVVGDPSFRNSKAKSGSPAVQSALDAVRLGGDQLAPLPGTRREALGVAATLRAANTEPITLLGEAATLTRVEQAVSGIRILHLATHGLIGSPSRPFDASLALATPKQPSIDDFGFLTLDRLIREWRGKLTDCELVVLSACDTSRGTRVGDSLMALPWGFFHAGAPTVIASLWRVDDVAASLLMQRFYQNLFGVNGGPMTVNQALGEARQWLRSASRRDLRKAGIDTERMIESGERAGSGAVAGTAVQAGEMTPYADPYYWAGFVLIGDPD